MEFRKQGMTSIIISHKLNEIKKVADKITILRDGGTVETLDCHNEDISEDRIIKGMVGRDMEDRYPPREPKIGETLLEVKNWNVFHQHHRDRQFLHNVNFNVRAGEVVGIAGLMGAGRTETAMSIFGKSWGHKITGEVFMHGKPVDVSTIPRAIDAGLAYVTEDRKQLGLVLNNNIMHNTTLANLNAVASNGVIDDHKERKVATDYRSKLAHPLPFDLSGGRQPVGRQPAEGRSVQMAVHQARSADPRRADARHRRRREIRNLYHHQPACRRGQRHPDDLIGNARTSRNLRPHLRHERRSHRRRAFEERSKPGIHHARHHALRGETLMVTETSAPKTTPSIGDYLSEATSANTACSSHSSSSCCSSRS